MDSVKIERRQPTRREWKAITSRRPVVRLVSPPKRKPKGRKEQPR
jgi:hypothetical protein